MAPRPNRSVLLVVPLTVVLALGVAAAAVEPEPASGPHPPSPSAPDTADDLPAGAVVADEEIYQLTRSGDRVYAVGEFRTVGRYAGPGAILETADGATAPGPEIADGQVSVAVGDGAGGWYLGGDFTRIDGHPAGGLAHVLHGGEIDTDFLPVADGLVSAMTLAGDTLYVGGAFTNVDGEARNRLAALSTENGSVLPFDAPQNGRVTELVFGPPDSGPAVLYVASNLLSAVDPTTGAAVAGFTAAVDTPITALELGGGHLYVGGRDVVALDPATGAVAPGFDLGEPMAVDTSRAVHTLLYTAERLYIGADRTLIGGRPGRLVAVDPATGAIDADFAPDITTERNLPYVEAGVYDLARNGDQLWAGGSFAGGLTVVDATTGAAVEMDLPSYHLQVNAVEQAGAEMFVGGHFYLTDAVRSHGLAAFDATTLDPVPGFRADTDAWGDVFTGAGAVWVAPTHFFGFDPSEEASTTSTYYTDWTDDVVAFDRATGARIAARSLRVKNLTGITTIGSRLYVARRLQNDVPFPRNRIDVYGPSGKRVDTFVVKPRGYISHLTRFKGDLVIAGSFVGSNAYWTSDRSMFRLNPRTGHPRRSFDPHTNGPVYDVTESRGGLVATGLFNRITGWYLNVGRPGLTRMDQDSLPDTRFRPRSVDGNRVLLDVQALGDLLWVAGAPSQFLDARTGKQAPDPTGWGTPGWVTGRRGDLFYTSMLFPTLGGRDGLKLGFVAAAD